MLIREAVTADADAIGRLHLRGWTKGYAGIVPDEYLATLSQRRSTMQWLQGLADITRPQTIVAVDDDDRVYRLRHLRPQPRGPWPRDRRAARPLRRPRPLESGHRRRLADRSRGLAGAIRLRARRPLDARRQSAHASLLRAARLDPRRRCSAARIGRQRRPIRQAPRRIAARRLPAAHGAVPRRRPTLRSVSRSSPACHWPARRWIDRIRAAPYDSGNEQTQTCRLAEAPPQGKEG